MSSPVEFEVVREHLGDKKYQAGDTRTMRPADAASLVPHVLRPKQEPALSNKMEPAPANKAAPRPKAKA